MKLDLKHTIELDHHHGIVDLYKITMIVKADDGTEKFREIGQADKSVVDFLKQITGKSEIFSVKEEATRSAIYFTTNHVVGIVSDK